MSPIIHCPRLWLMQVSGWRGGRKGDGATTTAGSSSLPARPLGSLSTISIGPLSSLWGGSRDMIPDSSTLACSLAPFSTESQRSLDALRASDAVKNSMKQKFLCRSYLGGGWRTSLMSEEEIPHTCNTWFMTSWGVQVGSLTRKTELSSSSVEEEDEV